MKFRIYDKMYNTYVEEPDLRWLLTRNGILYNTETDNTFDSSRYIIQEYTGLRHKGVEIYEGDIFVGLDFVGGPKSTDEYIVEWHNDLCRYVLTTGKGYDSRNCVDLTCDSIYKFKIK